MKANVYSLDGEVIEKVKLPEIFEEHLRPDLIKRAVLSIQTARIQPWGPNKMAGKRTTAVSRGAGYGIAMVPRIKTPPERAAFVPQAVGGRKAHPPKPEKIYHERINRKERRLALRSAIAATANKELVKQRGHRIDNVPEIPLIVEDKLSTLKKLGKLEKYLRN